MKKNEKIVLTIIISVFILSVLLIPRKLVYQDGGTVEYSAVLYKIVKWNQRQIIPEEEPTFRNDTEVCIFPTNYFRCKV